MKFRLSWGSKRPGKRGFLELVDGGWRSEARMGSISGTACGDAGKVRVQRGVRGDAELPYPEAPRMRTCSARASGWRPPAPLFGSPCARMKPRRKSP